MSIRRLVEILCLAFLTATPAWAAPEGQRQEERTDYYKKWLEQDVRYIITDEEKAVFSKLATDDERDQFIEQFWLRRDPNPLTAINEFKEEHYRRIAYANENFTSGWPGWATDRGRIYIIHGEPTDIERHPAGGNYIRPEHEGGGATATYPFEIWRYQYIEGIGQDIELEFVDPSFSGEYRLALNPEEKDAMLHIPGAGATDAELLGLASKADRPFFSPGNRETYPFMALRERDMPFQRFHNWAKVQAAPEIEYSDLKEIVQVNVEYDDLPHLVRPDYYRLDEGTSLVPVTVQVPNRNLSFERQEGTAAARLAVYGIVRSMTNRVAAEFEDELASRYRSEHLAAALQGSSIYQRMIVLENRMRYKLDLVVKDLNSGKVGVSRQAISPPPPSPGALTASSLVLSDSVHVLPEIPQDNAMFVIGDVKVRPNLLNQFPPGSALSAYLQVYNASIDQSSLEPSLEVRYRLMHGGEKVAESVDSRGDSVQLASDRRVVLLQPIPTQRLQPGRYKLRVEVEDRIRGQRLQLEQAFKIASPNGTDSSGR